jgi:hypothetical protein
MNPELAE